MSTYMTATATEPVDGRVLMQLDCSTAEAPDVRCQVVSATWSGIRLMVAILGPDGVLQVVDATTLRYQNK